MTSALPARRGRASAAGTSVEKAMRILEALAVPDGPHRLMDVAERAAVPRSTAYRVLATLTAEGFAENCGDGRYGVGGRLGGLGAQIVSAVSAGVGPALRRLQQGAGGNTVHLAVRVGDHAVYLHKVDSDKPYEMRSRVGNELLLHCTAIGKAILAHLPPDEVEAVSRRRGCRPGPRPRSPTSRRCTPSWRPCASAGTPSTTRRTRPPCAASAPRSSTGQAGPAAA